MNSSQSKSRIKAQIKEGWITVKALIDHPMEHGRNRDDQGQMIPAHYIQRIELKLNQAVKSRVRWGTGVSDRPFFLLKCQGRKGDEVQLTWYDNQGQTGSLRTKV